MWVATPVAKHQQYFSGGSWNKYFLAVVGWPQKNKKEKLVGWDKDRKITYQLKLHAEQTWLGENLFIDH